MNLNLNIFSLEKNVFYSKIKYLTLRGDKGNFSVYPQHSYLCSFVKSGVIRVIIKRGCIEYFYSSEGIIEVQPSVVSLIFDSFVSFKNLNKKKLINQRNLIEEKYNIFSIKKNSHIQKIYKEILKKIKFYEIVKKLQK